MTSAKLEHVNISVTDPKRLSDFLQKLCGWHVRWEGQSARGGDVIHIGEETDYLALYTSDKVTGNFGKSAPLNHIGILVDDLAAAEKVVQAAGLIATNHDNYEPGRRFYFFDWDGIEFEVISYE